MSDKYYRIHISESSKYGIIIMAIIIVSNVSYLSLYINYKIVSIIR